MKLKLGSRKSQLALTQATLVKDLLQSYHSQVEIEIVPITTSGDQFVDRSLKEIGGKGLFVKEIEAALESGKIDLAVHSMKDVPSRLLDDLVVPCVLAREDRRDVLIIQKSVATETFPELLNNKTIGTSSLRRSAQILALAPHCKIVDLRGNVDTRLKKLRTKENLDGIILAQAGLRRLGIGLDRKVTFFFDPSQMIPASGQGAIGIEIRRVDSFLEKLLEPLNCRRTFIEVSAERAFMAAIGGSCQVPVAATAFVSDLDIQPLTLHAKVVDENGCECFEERLGGELENAEALGTRVAESLLQKGASKILDRYHKGN